MTRANIGTRNGRLNSILPIAFALTVAGAWGWGNVTAHDRAPITVYVEAARYITKNQKIAADDLAITIGRHMGDDGLVIEPRQALGMVALADIAQGVPLKAALIYRPASKTTTPTGYIPSATLNVETKEIVDVRGLLEQLMKRPLPLNRTDIRAVIEAALKQEAVGVIPPGSDDQATLLALLRDLLIKPAGKETWLDVVVSSLEFGREAYKKGDSLEAFLHEFAKRAGAESAAALSDGMRVLATDIYGRLTTEEPIIVVPINTPQPHTHTVTLLAASGETEINNTEQQLADLIEKARLTPPNTRCAILVTGHSDTVGRDAQNYRLSEKRAQQVANHLRKKLPAVTITESGWGERRLAVWSPDASSEPQNRRVEITLNCNSVLD